jgi:NhaP-type Na+/H+ or K+/H+ antiporter
MYAELAILALYVFFYSLCSGRFKRTIISGPMIFVFSGLLMGPLVLNWFHGNVTTTKLRVLADLTLAITVLNKGLPRGEFMAMVVVCTVFLSLLAHGMTANPLAAWLGRKDQHSTTQSISQTAGLAASTRHGFWRSQCHPEGPGRTAAREDE